MNKKVALALASGGPRGFAYIGAIEELLDRGYEISSVAGVSAGSLVGGIYAAGGLQAFKEWLFGLDPVKVVALMDFSVSKNYLVKGEKVISAIKELVPDVNIEDLPIPFTAVATDLYTGEEVIFREGPLFDAIRASISIPSMFKPAQIGGRTLVDGGMVNTFPLNRVERTPGDILVGFNVNQIDAARLGLQVDGLVQHVGPARVFHPAGIEALHTQQDRDNAREGDRLITSRRKILGIALAQGLVRPLPESAVAFLVQHAVQDHLRLVVAEHLVEKARGRAAAHDAAVCLDEDGAFFVDHVFPVDRAVGDPEGADRLERIVDQGLFLVGRFVDGLVPAVDDGPGRRALFEIFENRGEGRDAVAADGVDDVLGAEDALLQEKAGVSPANRTSPAASDRSVEAVKYASARSFSFLARYSAYKSDPPSPVTV
jgi:predicted acylesterase/phospholipase RssA